MCSTTDSLSILKTHPNVFWVSMSNSKESNHGNEFLFAKVKEEVSTREKSKPSPHKPKSFEVDFDPSLTDIESIGVEQQVRETAAFLEKKTIRDDDEVFYNIYPKYEISQPNVKYLLERLGAQIVAYTDRKNNGFLLAASRQRLQKLSEKPTKYLTNTLRIIKPLKPGEQISNTLRKNKETQMAVLSIIPNLESDKNFNYMGKMITFLANNNCKLYGLDLQKYGFVFADVTLYIVNKLVDESTFIFHISEVPDAIAHEIRNSEHKKTKLEKTNSNNLKNKFLPTVVLMDSGVNPISSLGKVLISRDAYLFQNFDDEHRNLGHGTPIAHLMAYGENDKEPTVNIISYKIWSDEQKKWAFTGMINGIEKYHKETRFFVSSIGIPFLPLHQIVVLEKLVQEKNICLVVSGGNIQLSDIKACLESGAQYPDYLKSFPVIPPANGVNIVSIGSLAKKVSTKYTSLADSNSISPHSRCGSGAVELHDCKKPELVEHGGNINVDNSFNLNSEDVGVSSFDKDDNFVTSLSGSSFSSPLFARRLAQIEQRYRSRITNIETFLAISYLTSTKNNDSCWGYGEPTTIVGCDKNSAIYLAEGKLGFTNTDEQSIRTPHNDIVFYVPPRVDEIQLCIVHSDDFKKATIPTLETFLDVKTYKLGNNKLIRPQNRSNLDSKTNVKILTYKFDSKSMESIWTFKIRPRLVNDVLTEDKRKINVRYGCAILLKGKLARQSKKSLTQEVIENREKYM